MSQTRRQELIDLLAREEVFGERKHYHTPSRCRHESIHATRLRVEE